MMTVSESDVGSQKKLHSDTRHSRAVTGHAAVKADACRCGPKVVQSPGTFMSESLLDLADAASALRGARPSFRRRVRRRR